MPTLCWRAALPAVALALLGACSPGPTTPGQPLAGVYVLQRADGVPLPFVLSSEAGERYELLAESLTFAPDGQVLRARTFRHSQVGTGRDTTYIREVEEAYLVRGRRLEIGRFQPCPPNANCLANDVGAASSRWIELRSPRYGPRPDRPRLLFVRR